MQGSIGHKYFLFQHGRSGKFIIIFVVVFLGLDMFFLTIFLGPSPIFPAIAIDGAFSTGILAWFTNCNVWVFFFPIFKKLGQEQTWRG
jgi:hypothetical protein